MVSLQCDVHLLTLRPDTAVRDTDFSCYKYHDKAEARTQAERPYALDKTSFAAGRGHKWFLENKRPERLRSSLRELEDLLADQAVVASLWRGPHTHSLVLQSGLMVNISLNKLGDLTRISYDKYLTGKISEHVTDLQLTSSCVAVTYLEPKVTLITFGRPVSLASCEPLVNCDPRVHHLDLQCPPGRRNDRRIVLSPDSSQLCVWWPVGGQEVYPWSPELREEDRANLALVSLGHSEGARVLGYHRTASDPIYFRFLADSLHYLAQAGLAVRRGEIELENTILSVENSAESAESRHKNSQENTENKVIRRRASRSLAVSNTVVCHALIPNSDNVLLATADGTIFTFDQVRILAAEMQLNKSKM